MKALVTDKLGLMAIAMDSVENNRNRQLDPGWVLHNVHPDGRNLCVLSMDHNDVELRTMWLISVTEKCEGAIEFAKGVFGLVNIFIDCDYGVFDSIVTEIETDDLSWIETDDNMES